ncbi:MAG: O-antigen ligase domain-containing protein [Sphingobacteriia bacterium]|nr:MAG: O-antigen ligase domain-containing protein [Sphingobacteriia bacterium]
MIFLRQYRILDLISYLFFFIAGGLAIWFSQPWYLSIPFVWALYPMVSNFFILETKQLFWILLTLIPLSTELNLTSSLSLDFPIEIVLVIITVIATAKLFHQPSIFNDSLQSPLLLLVVFHLLWILISSFFSTTPLLSIKYFLAKIWYIIPFVMVTPIVLKNYSDWKKLALCMCIPMSVLVVQILFRQSLYSFEFGAIKKAMFPFFRNHVNYSSLLVCLVPIGWIIWKFTPNNTFQKKLSKWLLFTALIALILAYSRGAWLAMIIGLLSIFIFRKNWMGKTIIGSVILIGVIISSLSYQKNYIAFAPNHDQTIFHENFGEHLSATINRKDISNAERFHRWVAGARMITEKPIIGFGPNSFYHQYQPFTVSAFKTWVSNNPEHSTVHNYFLLIAIEQGIIGLILFIALFIYMLLEAQLLYQQFQSELYRTISLILGIVLVMIGVINCGSDMIETDKIGSVFWLCGGALIALKKTLKIESSSIAHS